MEIFEQSNLPKDWILQIIGDGVERNNLEKYVKDKRLEKNVCFLGSKNIEQCHGLKVWEDCAQAHAAAIDGTPVGTFGEWGSFHRCLSIAACNSYYFQIKTFSPFFCKFL